jgi:hypothetical protein
MKAGQSDTMVQSCIITRNCWIGELRSSYIADKQRAQT